VAIGTLTFESTESSRLVYEALLRSSSVYLYRSVAWARNENYWQDEPGRKSTRLNFELVHQRLLNVERTVIIADNIWPKGQQLPPKPLLDWIDEHRQNGVWIKLVRQSDLESEPDLLLDFGIYGSHAVGHMSSIENVDIFICSYCEQQLKFKSHQVGKRISCPKCANAVRIFANKSHSIVESLNSVWHYRRPKVLVFLGTDDIGPISDTEFLGLIQQGEIDTDTLVRSPEVTRGEFLPASSVNLSLVREMCMQRTAETQRIKNLAAKKESQQSQNRETLRRGIRQAIADGSVTLSERTQLEAFALKVGITSDELRDYLRLESASLLQSEIEEALADGIFDDRESVRISQLAIGLGITYEFTNEQQFKMTLARFAWRLLKLAEANEIDDERRACNVELFEVAALKRPTGIPLGDDHYLKSIGSGELEIGQKQLLFNGKFASKKYALSSLSQVAWYSDGVFCKRSTGKSLFVQPAKLGQNWYEFAMFFQFKISKEPVLGIIPTAPFIPVADESIVNQRSSPEFSDDSENDDGNLGNDGWQPSRGLPRFTFRVVGESYESRLFYLDQLRRSDDVYLRREPRNSFDPNAVAVTNLSGNILGYLKREVSEWFAPILDRGKIFRCVVHEKLRSGGIVIALFE
jgi:DNA-directed RNA polymerase subunit RPC12/RpoP